MRAISFREYRGIMAPPSEGLTGAAVRGAAAQNLEPVDRRRLPQTGGRDNAASGVVATGVQGWFEVLLNLEP
jgi:hypothetical protein